MRRRERNAIIEIVIERIRSVQRRVNYTIQSIQIVEMGIEMIEKIVIHVQ